MFSNFYNGVGKNTKSFKFYSLNKPGKEKIHHELLTKFGIDILDLFRV